MPIVITEILGTDSISGSRFTINANFDSLRNEVETIESVFGLSLTSGNIDVSNATGGSIRGKTGAFNSIALPATGIPTITLTGSTGTIVASILSISTSLSVPNINITLGGTFLNQGSSQFNGTAVFNEAVTFNEGIVYGKIDVGSTTSHTVLNSDRIIIFETSGSPGLLALTPDPSLLDGHTITLVYRGTGSCFLDTTNILGYTSGSIEFSSSPYKSSITLTYNLATSEWIVTASNNMTLI